MLNLVRAALAGGILLLPGAAWAQQAPLGITPCIVNPPAALSVSSSGSSVQLGTCGPTLIVSNTTTQGIYFLLASTATGANAVTTSANYLPGNQFVVLSIPTSGYWFGAITSTGTSTITFIQGRANS